MVALGTAGIFLPLVPTTPFLLLAAYLFAKGSRRWHDWLLSHKQLGPYIHAWRNKTGFTASQKARMIISLALTMGISIYFTPMRSVQFLVASIGLFWTVVLLRQKTFVATAVT